MPKMTQLSPELHFKWWMNTLSPAQCVSSIMISSTSSLCRVQRGSPAHPARPRSVLWPPDLHLIVLLTPSSDLLTSTSSSYWPHPLTSWPPPHAPIVPISEPLDCTSKCERFLYFPGWDRPPTGSCCRRSRSPGGNCKKRYNVSQGPWCLRKDHLFRWGLRIYFCFWSKKNKI